jgi:hypothetical protein
MHRSIFGLLGSLALLGASWSALAEGPPFKLEENFKATVVTTRPLPIGAKLAFSSPDLKPNEVFMLQRCGDPCNTAKMIRTWRRSDFDRNQRQMVALAEAGTYYFWILRTLENGEVGPVFGERSSFDELKGTVTFSSGTSVSVEVKLPSTSKQ